MPTGRNAKGDFVSSESVVRAAADTQERFRDAHPESVLLVQFVGSPGHGISADDARKRIVIKRAKAGDCGIDLAFCCNRPMHVAPHHTALLSAGIAVKIPHGHWGLIKSRSSTYSNLGLLVVDGVIDSGYTGPLFINVYNPGLDGESMPAVIHPFERIAQLIVMPYAMLDTCEVQQLPDTERGAAGFGSSGR